MNAAERAAPDGPRPQFLFGRALPREGRMGKGEQLPEVHFGSDVQKQLRKILVDHDAGAIIRRLEEIAAYVPALGAPDLKAARGNLETQRQAVQAVRRALGRGGNLVENLLTVELTLRGQEAANFMTRLWAGLVELERAITAIEARLRARRGGAPVDSAARWLVEETARELTEARVRVTHAEDGTLAKILRVLWLPILNREAPWELRPWFKILKSRR